MGTFNAKTFNSEVFVKYLQTIKQDKLVRILKSGALRNAPELAIALPEQVGGNYITRPIKGRLAGDPVIYDGATDITANSLGTYSQGIVVIGRAKGFKEYDFTEDITGHDFMSDVAAQLQEYWDNVNEAIILAILKGIFASALSANIYDCADVIGVTSLNNALGSIAGDLKDSFKLVYMHSAVATQLANANLLTYAQYNDKNGLQVQSDIAYWNGKLVLVTDLCPVTAVAPTYTLTSDVALDPNKTYYARSGSEGSYVYTKVAAPDVTDIATYYEMTSAGYNEYVTYVLGAGAFDYADCGVKVSVEMDRDPADDGGYDVLYSRERVIFAPYGLTFKAAGMSSKTPTNSELQTGSAWELVKDTSGNAISTKIVPFVAIKSRSN